MPDSPDSPWISVTADPPIDSEPVWIWDGREIRLGSSRTAVSEDAEPYRIWIDEIGQQIEVTHWTPFNGGLKPSEPPSESEP